MKRTFLILILSGIVLNVPQEAYAQLRKANRALNHQKYSEAMNFAQKLLADKPDDYKTWDLLARIHDAQSSQGPVEDYLMHVEEMVNAYNKVLELRPKEAESINKHLQIFYMQTFNQGIKEFNNAQAAAGDEILQAEYFQNSARHFQASSFVLPDSSGPYINWAYALLGARESQKAIEPLKLALEYGGPDEELYSFLARIYLTSDLAQDAIPLLEEAVVLFPSNPELQDFLLNAYAETGQNDRALEKYAEAVINNPENKIYRYNYGSLLLQAEEFDAAIEQLQEAVNIDPTYIDAYYNVGAAYINKANAVQQQISSMDDVMRERRDDLSDEEEQSMIDEIDMLLAERRALYQSSIAPLENARENAEKEEGRSMQEICIALFQAYAQTGEEEKAVSFQECAGV